MKKPRLPTRWEVQALGLRHRDPPRKRTRWRSDDLRGALPRKVVRALEMAIASLPGSVPWPEVDEEAWWRDVMSDPRVRTPTAKNLPHEGWRSRFRLDRQQCVSTTFTCNQCRQQRTVSIVDLIKQLGADRNVATIGNEVLECPNKRARREGYNCSVRRISEVTN